MFFIYRLRDPEERVRCACLDFIIFLALSDLVKVREQLSETAACLCDSSVEVRGMYVWNQCSLAVGFFSPSSVLPDRILIFFQKWPEIS